MLKAAKMRFSLSVLAVIGPVILMFCSTLAMEENQLVSGRSLRENLPEQAAIYSNSRRLNRRSECTRENISVRKEWRKLSIQERKNYVQAVLCLRSVRPALYEKEVQGASSRYDDFQLVHINQTFFIHINAKFVAWHRWFTWTYERALRNDCGYKGFQPYWDWTLDADNIEASPLFDGSDSSMSGNGVAVPHNDTRKEISLPSIPVTIVDYLPAGTGGGCVVTGPFANITVSFGPVSNDLNTGLLNNPHNLDYKPHCLRRDFSADFVRSSVSADKVRDLLNSPNATVFNGVLDASIHALHGGPHNGVGGEMADLFASAGDPLFFLHHAQIDRLWTQWQQLDPATRQYALSGTGSVLNYPPTPVFQLNDTINLGKLSPEGPRPIRDFMSTVQGPFCYEYA